MLAGSITHVYCEWIRQFFPWIVMPCGSSSLLRAYTLYDFCGMCSCKSLLDIVYLTCLQIFSHDDLCHGVLSLPCFVCTGWKCDYVDSNFLGWDILVWLDLLGDCRWCIGLRGDGNILGSNLGICMGSKFGEFAQLLGQWLLQGGWLVGVIAFSRVIAGTSCADWALPLSCAVLMTTGEAIVLRDYPVWKFLLLDNNAHNQ